MLCFHTAFQRSASKLVEESLSTNRVGIQVKHLCHTILLIAAVYMYTIILLFVHN